MGASSSFHLELAEIEKARTALAPLIEPTPLIRNRWLSEAFHCDVFLKLESMQPIGSFKIRGATYKIASLSKAQRRKGVITASAGNHAQGVAWGCAQFGVKATIVMPQNAPLTKILNTEALGAEIILAGENYDEANQHARALAVKKGSLFVHAYADEKVIAGQGTVGLEILEQLPEVEVVIGSMGGGGLMSGVGTVLHHLKPQVQVIGVQAKNACSLVESIRKNKIVSTGRADTFADGIKVITVKPEMLRILKNVLDQTDLATDDEIADAVLLLMEKAQIVAEGAAALPLAILKKRHKKFKKKKVVLIVSGGNIDMNLVAKIIDTGLAHSGRRVRINATISDKPGALHQLTGLIARHQANVLQVIHDRNSPHSGIAEIAVELSIETRGPQYTKQLIQELRQNTIRLAVMK